MILKGELSSKNNFETINLYAIPALLHRFPVLDRTITKLEIIDRETRKMLQQYYVMYSQSDVTPLYLPRKNGSRGLNNITNQHKNVIFNFGSYLLNPKNNFWSYIKLAGIPRRKIYPQEGTAILWWNWPRYSTTGCHEETATEIHHQICMYQHTAGGTQKKEYAPQFAKYLDQPHVDKVRSTQWLKSSTLKKSK